MKDVKTEIKLDFERIYIEHNEFYPKAMVERHVNRYEWALTKLSKDDTVLDLCCGSGYGSNMIAKKCKKVYGIDKSADGINYAQKHYNRNNLIYSQADLTEPDIFPEGENIKFNSIVFIEAIEHIEKKYIDSILMTLKSILVPSGKLIITTVDKEQSEGKNEYHLNEYTAFELKSLVRKYFKIDEIKIEDKFVYLVAKNV
jgi:cyclopropane fatty-acyl-phospholipid synthase-like methyltransferase